MMAFILYNNSKGIRGSMKVEKRTRNRRVESAKPRRRGPSRTRRTRKNEILYALIAVACAALVLVCIALIDVIQSKNSSEPVAMEFKNYENRTAGSDEAAVNSSDAVSVQDKQDDEAKPDEDNAESDSNDISAADAKFLILVNRQYPNESTDRPSDLITMGDFFSDEVTLQNPQGSINKTAAAAAKEMFEDARDEGIGKYIITTAYRSVAYQEAEYEEYMRKNPGRDIGKVLPGKASEHTTGLAIDILSESHNVADDDFFYTQEGKWLYDNAYKYGFILRYPKDKEEITGVIFEPWHYRYVGKAAAKQIHESGMCLEEYLGKAG